MNDNEQLHSPCPERPSSPTLLPSEPGEGSQTAATGKAPSPGSTGRVPATGCPLGRAVGGEGDPWRESLPAVADRLREIGYDIASPQSGAASGGSIVARRDLGDRAVLLAIDAGGRFRAEITWVVGEWPSQDEVAGVPVQVVDAVSRAVTVTGQLVRPEQVVEVLSGLGKIAAWAGVAET